MTPPKSQAAGRKPPKVKGKPLDSPEDCLAAGVELEEAGEKWRAGDAAKSLRFFRRAIDNYDLGLRLFPGSFDLAYNKARVQFDISQQPFFVAQLQDSVEDLLTEALESHRRALVLDRENTDVLFNTAQLLTAIAERASNDGDDHNASLLREATTLLEQCLAKQEALYAEHLQELRFEPPRSNEQAGEIANDLSAAITEHVPGQADFESRQWATVMEPITKFTLIDTIVALLDTLTVLCSVVPIERADELTRIELYVSNTIQGKLSGYLDGLDDDTASTEASMSMLKFKAALAEAEFKTKKSNVATYEQRLIEIFETELAAIQNPMESYEFLSSFAEALMSFSAATASFENVLIVRYNKLAKALDCLTRASKLPGVPNLASLHLCRGDLELLRLSLVNMPEAPENLGNAKVRDVLLKNAETYYRGAVNIAQSSMHPSPRDVVISASVRQAVANSMIHGNNDAFRNLLNDGIGNADIQNSLSEMLDEALVSQDQLHELGIL